MKTQQEFHNNIYNAEDIDLLRECTLCPRECRVDRFRSAGGFCGTDAGFNISSICVHKGEEPAISGLSGICNVFFSGCNLRCIYCQNYEISRHGSGSGSHSDEFENILNRIENILSEGIRAVGFVSPSHVVPQVRAIITGLRARGINPVTVYNTNGYDKVETLRSLSGLIDVFLPDLKYVTSELAFEYSGGYNYPEVALKAIKEIYYQKGSTLTLNEDGAAENGLVIRHLVLPGHADESIKVLRTLAGEVSSGVAISLMSQYHTTEEVFDHTVLGRTLHKHEYELVVNEMEKLGFRNGWVQEMDSHSNYRPDFSREQPFE